MKLNEHYKISFRSMKNDSDEIFEDKLRTIKQYSNHTCGNNAYQEFVTKFFPAVDFILSEI